MRHYIAYHNTEKMGHPLHQGEPLRLLTSKPVDPLIGNTVWFITGEGTKDREYSLGSVFRVTHVGEAAEGGFKHFASGTGHVFSPPVAAGKEPWFAEVLRATGHFGLGVSEIKDAAVISALTGIAARFQYAVA